MPELVLDASIMLTVALPDEDNGVATRAVKRMIEHSALVPCHWLLEIGNGLLMAERRRRISSEMRNKALVFISALPFELDQPLRDVVWSAAIELAASHGLTLYDAVYLELAARNGLPLATLDDDLHRAARNEGVRIFQ
jgi:predicted nucleic acid-binding protein